MDKKNFYYDPQRQGYDQAVWKTISGTPAISSNLLRLNTATIVGHTDIYSADLAICATVPVAPTAAQDKRFGFAQLNMGAYVGFKIDGSKFYIEAASPDTSIVSTEVAWNSDWTAQPVVYRILWSNNQVKFYIKLLGSNNEVEVGRINDTVALPKWPMSLHVRNANADNLDLRFLDLRDAVAVLPSSPIDIAIQDIEIGAVELKDGTTDSRAIINAANTARAADSNVVVAQIVDASGLVNTVSSNIISPSTLTAGETFVAVSGTRVALGSSLATKSIYIRAKITNTGNVYVGDTNVDAVTSRQIVLAPDDAICIDIANRANLFVDAAVGGGTEGVDYLCMS